LIGGLVLAIEGCVSKGKPTVAIGTPQFVPQSQPDSVIETGIGQDPATGGIFLQWYRTEGAAGYKMYRSDTTNLKGLPVNFSIVGNVAASSSLNDTSMVDDNSITTGVEYYYYMMAYGADGTVSNLSDTINYRLLNRPAPHYPGGPTYPDVVSASGLYFSWFDPTGLGYICIRVKDVTVIPFVTIWVSRRFQVLNPNTTKFFNFDSTGTGGVISGHSYQWRVDWFAVDGTGRPYEGSRSVWVTFTVK
jgi:hypothetical protein